MNILIFSSAKISKLKRAASKEERFNSSFTHNHGFKGYPMQRFLFLTLLFFQFTLAASPVVLSEGRFRPLEVHAETWQFKYLKDKNRGLETLWKMHLLGIEGVYDTPLIYIKSAHLKEALGLDAQASRFTPAQIEKVLSTPSPELKTLLLEEVAEEYSHLKDSKKLVELKNLSPSLFAKEGNGFITIQSSAETPPWNFLQPGDKIAALHSAPPHYLKEWKTLLETWASLKQPGMEKNLILAFPPKDLSGKWLSLATAEQKENPTGFKNATFEKINHLYLKAKQEAKKGNFTPIAPLTLALEEAYLEIEGKPYLATQSKIFFYPSQLQVKIEAIYFAYPWIEGVILLYLGSFFLFLFPYSRRVSSFCFALSALSHLLILTMRSYVLMRPPVANMFETLLYVPFILVAASLFLPKKTSTPFLKPAAALGAAFLLLVMRASNLETGMNNLQAVLDSQFWLSIHVLMVVGSYGIFILGGVLGHLFLWKKGIGNLRTEEEKEISNSILQTMYWGLFLLIPGTLLGGVWAAESWGRFWDWDPKESWAFITSCIYLLFVHSKNFSLISHLGIANGAVLGALAVSFTWYGVNYLLGTGLHSYGFGEGGQEFYFLFLAVEGVFLLVTNLKIIQKVGRKSL